MHDDWLKRTTRENRTGRMHKKLLLLLIKVENEENKAKHIVWSGRRPYKFELRSVALGPFKPGQR